MTDDAPQLPQQQDPDLVRWARALGVTYEELVSTLDYAGPTFKDGIVELNPPETPVLPRDTAAPCLPDAGNTPGALSPGIAAARHLPR
jgi:hypothetical protein